MNKPYIDHVLIVEGNSDKAKILSLFDASIFVTNGYDVDEGLIKLLSEHRKILVLTDDDDAGKQIRSKINNLVKCENVEISASACDKHHKHGVAESNKEALFNALKPYVVNKKEREYITNIDLYNAGINSKRQRDNICHKLSINRYSQKQLLEIINIIGLKIEETKKYAD
ncbi:MAG: DUF4093 domain-containing protein [Bacilli bacterium]|nr:DUF4093 domain-containing protein [Bacilli bacterium]